MSIIDEGAILVQRGNSCDYIGLVLEHVRKRLDDIICSLHIIGTRLPFRE
jgi:hypothetical protein